MDAEKRIPPQTARTGEATRSLEATKSAETTRLLVVDDEESIRISLAEALSEAGTEVRTAVGGEEAFRYLAAGDVDLVLLDQRLSQTQEDGLDLLRRIKAEHPATAVIMMTAYGRFESAVEATRLGCYQYIAKPLDLHQLKLLIRNALATMALGREVRRLRAEQRRRFAGERIIGASPAIEQFLESLKRVARSPSTTVLLRGETGTGKELAARQIHSGSPVAGGPFVDVNCSAVPDNLLESELFGHERGAFTDAKSAKEGLFELAHGGTLFLDEIAEMPAKLQAKLLRVLESKTFRRVGGTQDVQVSVRIVAATNRDLQEEVAQGRFREDLYYRLSVVPLDVPPLRERRGDIPALVKTFLDLYGREIGRPVHEVSPQAMDLLTAYDWPGNVRELRNLMERLVLMGSQSRIEAADLPEQVRTNRGRLQRRARDEALFRRGRIPSLDDVERAAIRHALAEVA
ncbi:MAG: sigma-54-dependent Fis family transcriptional regulator, partial [Candidatus Eisenbacteria bacterium]|nr:sigma-54-dependent Fis family transcriptional regulator [Candidatus Eisenbacteria bacterium]